MPKPEKIEAVAELVQDLKTAECFYFVDYRGLTFAETTELRKRLKQVGANFKVVKNTLLRIAAQEAGVEGIDHLLEGPTAMAFCAGDPVPVAKVLQDFIREKKKTAIKGARLDRTVIAGAQVEWLATLPGRDQLVAQVVGLIAAPLSGLVTVLSSPLRGLVVALDQIQKQKAAA